MIIFIATSITHRNLQLKLSAVELHCGKGIKNDYIPFLKTVHHVIGAHDDKRKLKIQNISQKTRRYHILFISFTAVSSTKLLKNVQWRI